WLTEQDEDAGLAAWAQELSGLEEPTLVAPGLDTALPTRPARATATLDPDTTARLTDMARTRGLTLNTVV
ncbi:hypothetical protein, partial [Streptomyces sp. KLOTTS4A1]|uniref:hypothetical protein n=1 Tax=Streptomyces sp. KLOTTS4A1 TaxID=3390996 RepID=UPI0039F49844